MAAMALTLPFDCPSLIHILTTNFCNLHEWTCAICKAAFLYNLTSDHYSSADRPLTMFLTLGKRSAYVVHVQLLSCWVLYQDFLQNCRLTDSPVIFFQLPTFGLCFGPKFGHIAMMRWGWSYHQFTNEPGPKIQLLFSSFSSKILSRRVHGAHIYIERSKQHLTSTEVRFSFFQYLPPAFYIQPPSALSFSGAKAIHLPIGSQFKLPQNDPTSQFVNVILCEQSLSYQLDLELKLQGLDMTD